MSGINQIPVDDDLTSLCPALSASTQEVSFKVAPKRRSWLQGSFWAIRSILNRDFDGIPERERLDYNI